MTISWQIYVEGKTDMRFLECLIEYMNLFRGKDSPEIIKMCGGINKLHLFGPQMRTAQGKRNKVAVLLDADKDAKQTKKKLRRTMEKHRLPIDSFFLIPGNGRSGCLETLLMDIVPADHHPVLACFDQHVECIQTLSAHYGTPKDKAKIYAYTLAVGGNPTAGKTDYRATKHWNLEAEALMPFKQFLRKLT